MDWYIAATLHKHRIAGQASGAQASIMRVKIEHKSGPRGGPAGDELQPGVAPGHPTAPGAALVQGVADEAANRAAAASAARP